LLDITEQEIDVQAAFVRFVDDQRVVLRQPTLTLGFREQDAVGHHFDEIVAAALVGEAHLVADHVTERGPQLGRNPGGH
jgi:hypothetical protein